MKIHKALVQTCLVIILSGCLYLPKKNDDGASINACNTYTKSMSLEKIDLLKPSSNKQSADNASSDNSSFDRSPSFSCGGDRDCNKAMAAIAAGVVIVVAGSAIVSGSIVVVNNTAHWMEYQGTCSDGYLNQSKQWFLESIRTENHSDMSGATNY